MGTEIVRRRGEKTYLYYAYYMDGVRREVYCGTSADPKSKDRARDAELEELREQQKRIAVRIRELKGQ